MCKTMFEADTVMQKLIDSVEGRKKNGGGFIPFTPAELDLVKELAAFGGDISGFVSPQVHDFIYERLTNKEK